MRKLSIREMESNDRSGISRYQRRQQKHIPVAGIVMALMRVVGLH